VLWMLDGYYLSSKAGWEDYRLLPDIEPWEMGLKGQREMMARYLDRNEEVEDSSSTESGEDDEETVREDGEDGVDSESGSLGGDVVPDSEEVHVISSEESEDSSEEGRGHEVNREEESSESEDEDDDEEDVVTPGRRRLTLGDRGKESDCRRSAECKSTRGVQKRKRRKRSRKSARELVAIIEGHVKELREMVG